MRGKHDDRIFVTVADRITPAGAGKTINLCPDRAIARDHPRRCGENDPIPESKLGTLGSPPQVRGKRMLIISHREELGITPAGAGKTVFRKLNERTNQDHPRRCGENVSAILSKSITLGSPPQVRGKRSSTADLLFGWGITPAGAGKTKLYQNLQLHH